VSRISFVRPSKTVPISVTGRECALNCIHCAGKYLVGKIGVENLSEIEHAPSYLITGGCDANGKVPIIRHLDKLRALPEESTRIAHTGLMDEKDVEILSDTIDVVSFDFVGDDRTINEIYGLNRSVKDYEESYEALSGRIPTHPHLTIGLYKGRLAGELQALDFLADPKSKSVVLNVFKPTAGTAIGELPPPSISDVRRVFRRARDLFNDVYIGCMRPGGRYREKLDVMAVDEGCDRIVNPTRPARELAEERELEPDWKEECCIL
jgi:uncharacterized radical SAM superfamily protein